MCPTQKLTEALLGPDAAGSGKKAAKKRGSSFQTVSALFRVRLLLTRTAARHTHLSVTKMLNVQNRRIWES